MDMSKELNRAGNVGSRKKRYRFRNAGERAAEVNVDVGRRILTLNELEYEEHTNTYALDRAMAEILWVEAKKKAPPFGGASMSWDIQAAKVRLHSGTALPPTC